MNADEGRTICRTDRLLYSKLDDEPFGSQYIEYQEILDKAYRYKDSNDLYEACMLLEQATDFARSLYQAVRTQYILALYYRGLDADLKVLDHHGREDPLGTAADHYAQGADYASQIPDSALFAQLKKFESDRCYRSNPYRKRYRRAVEAAQVALAAWRACDDLRNSTHASGLHFEYQLADDLAVRAQMVADDHLAVDSLTHAATLLLKLRECSDHDPAQYLNDDFLLAWNWAALHHSMGKYHLALKRAFEARDKAHSASTPLNYGRVNILIAEIALDCLDIGATWSDFSPVRLLNVAEKAKDEAIEATEEIRDEPGYVLTMLTEARWLGRTRWRKERTAKLIEAKKRASSVLDTDPLLFGRVEIAWGDEFAYRNLKRKSQASVDAARNYYLQAYRRFRDVEALGLARIANKRLVRLRKQVSLSRKPFMPRPGDDLSCN
jgi:hypothetical protein